MPYNNYQGVYVPSGNPDTTHYAPPYAAGETGRCYDTPLQRSYQIVTIDPTLDPTLPTGPVLPNQPAIWKDKPNYIVTNVPTTPGGEIAGVFRTGALPGEIVHILQAGYNIPVASDGTGAAGATATLSTSGPTARVTSVAAGTFPPTKPLGTIKGAAVAGVINVDVSIQPAT